MRANRNLHPEWGYVAPAPSFFRNVRIVLVTTLVSATATVAAVFSLIGQPQHNESQAARRQAATQVVRQVVNIPAKPAPEASPVTARPQVPAAAQDASASPVNGNDREQNAASAKPAAPSVSRSITVGRVLFDRAPDPAKPSSDPAAAASAEQTPQSPSPQAEPAREGKLAHKAKPHRHIVARQHPGNVAQFGTNFGGSPFGSW